MKRPFTPRDRAVLILDRILMTTALVSFLWVTSLQKDFRILMVGLWCMVGLFFTSRYMLVKFKVDSEDPKE